MTQKEMTEIFGVMLLAYPNAETFKGGIQKLAPTINLWCTCLTDVDFWTAEQAVIKLCRECKFPPTIAEFKEKADAVTSEVRQQIDADWNLFLRQPIRFGNATPQEVYDKAPAKIKAIVDDMGGPDKLLITEIHTMGDGSEKTFEMFNFDGFRAAYERSLRGKDVLPGGSRSAISVGEFIQIRGIAV